MAKDIKFVNYLIPFYFSFCLSRTPMISKLPDKVIARIAAGEVIASPFNIIKELIENSLDANSQHITLFLSSSLLSLVVSDDGSGIDKEDLPNACADHFTSKISSFSDIKHCGSPVSSFGFRGEALHSISQVGHVKIITRTKNESAGFMATYENGEMKEIKRMFREKQGTTVEIENIFHNNRIRKEQFAGNKRELARCVDLVKSYSVSNSGIDLFVDSKVVIPLVKTKRNISQVLDKLTDGIWTDLKPAVNIELIEIIKCKIQFVRSMFVYAGSEEQIHYLIMKNMLQETEEKGSCLVLFSTKTLYFKKSKFVLFINRRLVLNEKFKREINGLYKGLLGSDQYPFVFIELFLPYVDVNAHPSKAEVIFDEQGIYDKIINEMKKVLINENYVIYSERNKPTECCENESIKDTNISQPDLSIRMKDILMPDKEQNSIVESQVKIYARPAQVTLEESFCEIEKGTRGEEKHLALLSVNNIINEIEKVEDSLFKEAVFIGTIGEFVYAQSGMYLLQIVWDIFIYEAHYLKILESFGNIPNTKIEPSPTSLNENTHGFLKEYFGIEIVDNCVISAPILFGEFISEWSDFSVEKTDEYSTFKACTSQLAQKYTEMCLESVASLKRFNIIKREICVTKRMLDATTIVTSLKDLYKKFGRC